MSEANQTAQAWFGDYYEVIGEVRMGLSGVLHVESGVNRCHKGEIEVDTAANYDVVHYYEPCEGDYVFFIRKDILPTYPSEIFYQDHVGNDLLLKYFDWCTPDHHIDDFGDLEFTSKDNMFGFRTNERCEIVGFASYDENGNAEALAFAFYRW